MKTDNVLEQMVKVLGDYLRQEDVTKFYRNLTLGAFPEEELSLNGANFEMEQLNSEIPVGADERAQVDSIITYAEKRLTKQNFMELLVKLSRLMIDNGELETAIEINEEIIHRTEITERYEKQKAQAYLALGDIAHTQARWDDCFGFIETSSNLFSKISNNEGLAKCENILGAVYGDRGEIKIAEAHFQKGREYISQESNDTLDAMFEMNIGILNSVQGKYEEALSYFESSIMKFEELKDTRRLAIVQHNMGMAYTKMKNYFQALREFDNCINTSLRHGYLSNCAVAYLGKGFVYVQLKNAPLAERFTNKAMEIACKLNDTLSIAEVYRIKGIIQQNLNNIDLCEELFENSLRLNKDLENEMNKAENYRELGEVYNKLNKQPDAEIYSKEAMKYYDKIQAKATVDEIQNVLEGMEAELEADLESN